MHTSVITFKNLLDTEYTLELRNWRNKDFVRENMTNQKLISEKEHIKYLEMLRDDHETRKVFVAFDDNIPFAIVGFIINADSAYIEPATYLVDERFLGKGYGLVMSYAKLEYIFGIMPEGKMRTIILRSNKRNLKLQEKCGGEISGQKSLLDKDGIKRDAYILTITKQQWEEKRNIVLAEIRSRFGNINIGRIPV